MSFGTGMLIWASQMADRARRAWRKRPAPLTSSPPLQEEIRTFCEGASPPERRALISLKPEAWKTALASAPDIRYFNMAGFTYETVKALNQRGFSVDIVDCEAPGLEPQKHYDLFLGHGGQCRSILDRLSSDTFVMHFATGAYWQEFNRMSQERYDNFSQRRGLPKITTFYRMIGGKEEGLQGEEYLARRAHAGFNSGPRTIATFQGISPKMSLLYLGAYVPRSLVVEERDFKAGRRNFVYVAGTSGNIQKGLDLLLEAFARLPHLHLYIYCKVEAEVSRVYRKELARPNIHYVYHYAWQPLQKRMRNLLKSINFTISAPIDTGPGTAFLGSMGLGLIPVGYVDIEAEESNSVLVDSYSIEAIMDAAQRASEKSAEWCREASRQTLERFQRLHTPSQFGSNFKAYLEKLGL